MSSQRKVFIHSRKINILLTLLLFAKPPAHTGVQSDDYYAERALLQSLLYLSIQLAPTSMLPIMLAET